MKNVKNLIIDLGGVLINLTRNRCLESFEHLGIENIRELLTNNYHHKELFEQFELGNITLDEFRNRIRSLSQKNLTDVEIDRAWVSMLGDIPTYKLDLLLKLRQHFNTVLLSNTNEIHWEWAKNTFFRYKGLSANDFFSKIYLSYELHLQKPSTDIFKYVLTDSVMLANETMLIDDASVNCRAAETLGIKTYMPQANEDWSFLFSE